ncbi:MAG: hypothetical protein GY795_41475 [Desulfobacterales bacterium]|nr:hypothetical protein [Desulfobacterales bacterium]
MRKTSSKSLFQTLQNLIRKEKKILNPVRLLSIWEKQRLHEFLKHLDPPMLILMTGITICIILTGIFAYAFLNQTGVFKPPPLDPVMDFRVSTKYYTKPLSNHFGLFEDQSKIWLGTKGDGVHEYAFDTKIWEQYTQKSTDQQLTGDYVEEILPDAEDIWLRAGPDEKKFGLSKFNIGNKTWQTLIGTQTFSMTSLNSITAIESGGENITWVGTDRFGLNRYNAETRTWEINEPPLFGRQITSLKKNEHALFAGATKGLFKIKDMISAEPNPHTFFTDRYVKQLEQDKKKQVIYYLSDKGEIGQVSSNNDHAIKLINEKNNFYKYNKLYINDNEITAVDDDKQSNFWIGTRHMGLAFYDKNHHAWKGFNTSNTKEFLSNRVHTVTSGEWGVAAGTKNGLFVMDSSWKSKHTFCKSKTVPRVEQGETNDYRVLWGKTSLLSKKLPSKTLPKVKTKRIKVPLEHRKKSAKLKHNKLSAPDKNKIHNKKQQKRKSISDSKLAENTIERFQFKKNASVKTTSHATFIGRNLVDGLKPEEMVCAVADKHSQIWIGSEGKGILVYKLDRRDWVRHEYIFQKSDFLDLMHIRHLAIKKDDISYIYLVTKKGGVGRFQPISVKNSSKQEKISVEAIIHEGGKNMNKVSDVAIHGGALFVARQAKGIVVYDLKSHRWDDIPDTRKHNIRYFQKTDNNLYGLTTTGNIIEVEPDNTSKIPSFSVLIVKKDVDEFYINRDDQFIIKTRNGKLIVNDKILIPNSYMKCSNFNTENIISVAMDDTGNASRIWIATEKCLGLYNIKAHAWEKNRHFNHHIKAITYTSKLLSKRLWVHTKEKVLFLLDPISFKQIKLIPAVESITFIDNKAFAIRRVNNEKELVQINSKGKHEVIISATAFGTVNQKDIKKAVWDPNQNFLFLGANGKVGRYAHNKERTWDSQNIEGNVLKMFLNSKLWVHTSENYLHLLGDKEFPIELSIPEISDFTADTNPVSSDGYALYANHELKMISPQKKVPLIEGQASFDEFPRNTDSVALTTDESKIFIASPSA